MKRFADWKCSIRHGPSSASRRNFLSRIAAGAGATLFAGWSGALRAAAGSPRDDLVLVISPHRIFKALDPGNEQTESWYFYLSILGREGAVFEPQGALFSLYASGRKMKTIRLSDRSTRALMQPGEDTDETALGKDGEEPLRELFYYRLGFREPVALEVDRVVCEFERGRPGGGHHEWRLDVPVSRYTPKTRLMFPFRGQGIVTAGAVNNGGHSNRSGQFAVDAIGLTKMYAPQISAKEKNESYAGWRRDIIAPAEGLVIASRNDVPNQPAPGSNDPASFTMPDGSRAETGNYVLINHGHSECSVLMHMDTGSVRVKKGDRVRQGQTIGQLGNSGDSFAPHLHYQLQSGPDLFDADGLPLEFANLNGVRMIKGAWFDAR